MAMRPQIRPQQVITSGDMSTATVTSAVTIIEKISMLSYQFTWSGSTPTGSLALQVSNTYALNPDGTVANAGTWTTIYFLVAGSQANSISVSGNTGSAFADIPQTGAYAIRAVYTKSGGTGTLQAWFNGKVA